MNKHTVWKSLFASLAVVLLVLGYSFLIRKTGYSGDFVYPYSVYTVFVLYASDFVGKDFIRFIFTLIVSIGYESALWLIFRNSNARKLKIFLPSGALLILNLFVGYFLIFRSSWGDWTIILPLISILTRVCISAVIMSCTLAILIKDKK